jgi:hypothetical protein
MVDSNLFSLLARHSLSIGVSPFSYFLLIVGLSNKNGDPNFCASYGAASSGENHMACDRPKFIHDVAICTDLPMIPIYRVS